MPRGARYPAQVGLQALAEGAPGARQTREAKGIAGPAEQAGGGHGEQLTHSEALECNAITDPKYTKWIHSA